MSNKPDFWEGYVPEPVKPAQQEPDWLNKEQTETDWDHVWLLIKAASYASSKGFVSGTTNWGSAVSRYMRNESPQLAQQEPVAFLVDGDLYYPEEIDWETLQEQGHTVASLYTQAQRTWQGLTDEEIEQGCKESWVTEQAWQSAVWWAEAKLKEKNT